MSVLDRTLPDMEILEPIYTALGLLGIHILDIPLPNDRQKDQLLIFLKVFKVPQQPDLKYSRKVFKGNLKPKTYTFNLSMSYKPMGF